jgi:phosphoglycerate dehydrogenase-like enzyme
MQIVVMDDITLSDEHIHTLKSVGELVVYQGTPNDRDEILSRAKDATIILSGWTQYPKGIFKELPDLKMISLWATGKDYVDLEEAENAGIKVTNVPGYARNAVAELAFALILAVVRKIPQSHANVRATHAYNWHLFEGSELAGKTLGILGTGAIGVKVAQIARGFDMEVIAFDMYPRMDLEAEGLFNYVGFQDVFSQSDIVTVHMPLFPETKGIITEQELKAMPRHGVLINTARAGLIDQEALTKALEEGVLAGAGLDDMDLEHPSSRRLMAMDQVILTPHMGFFTTEAIQVKTHICVENVRAFVLEDQK